MASGDDRREFLRKTACAGAGALGVMGVRAAAVPAGMVVTRQGGPEQRVRELGLVLPAPQQPSATLVPAVLSGTLLFVSGHGPARGAEIRAVGKVGADMTPEEGQAVARAIGLNVLATVRNALSSLDRVVRLVKALGMVNSAPDFTGQPAVINGFSELLIQVFGEAAGKGARSAVGMASLPGGWAVEIEAIFEVRPA
jgi:enamine deaminase RidA (YjgF/YER057c/UK114 family)